MVYTIKFAAKEKEQLVLYHSELYSKLMALDMVMDDGMVME